MSAVHASGKLIIVSNRLPFVLKKNELTQKWERKARCLPKLYGTAAVRPTMFQRLAASAAVAFRRPLWTRQPASNFYECQSLGFKMRGDDKSGGRADEVAVKKPRPKTVPVPKITLLGPDRELSVVTMDVADKMCERRGLKLVKIVDVDTKTRRPVYRMMTAAQFIDEDGISKSNHHGDGEKDRGAKSKSEKTALVNCRIGEADLESKVKNFCKWLQKMHEVRVTVSGDTANEIADKIVESTQEYSKVVQRRVKGDSVKFQLVPIIKTNLN